MGRQTPTQKHSQEIPGEQAGFSLRTKFTFHYAACKALCKPTACSLFDLSFCFSPPRSLHFSCTAFLANPENTKHISALGPLHRLFPLPGKLIP